MHSARKMPIRPLVWSFATALVIAAGLAIEYALIPNGYAEIPYLASAENPLVAAALIVGLTFAFSIAGLFTLFRRMDEGKLALAQGEATSASKQMRLARRVLPISLGLKNVVMCTLVIMLIWSPVIIMSFPCNIHYDTMSQIYQFQTDGPTYYVEVRRFVDANFIDHHPVFTTLVYGSFYSNPVLSPFAMARYAFPSLCSTVLLIAWTYWCARNAPIRGNSVMR